MNFAHKFQWIEWCDTTLLILGSFTVSLPWSLGLCHSEYKRCSSMAPIFPCTWKVPAFIVLYSLAHKITQGNSYINITVRDWEWRNSLSTLCEGFTGWENLQELRLEGSSACPVTPHWDKGKCCSTFPGEGSGSKHSLLSGCKSEPSIGITKPCL